MSTPAAEGFAASYARLRDVVDRLRASGAEDVDELVGLVQQAAEAHRACKARVAAVRALIGEAPESESESESGGAEAT